MRENRTSGSEGGGTEQSVLPTPIGQAEQGVEVEAAQRASVGAHPEVTLGQDRLHEHRQRDHERRREQGYGPSRRIEPDNPGGRQEEFEAGAGEPTAEVGQMAQPVDAVAALGHVGAEATLKIPIAQTGNLT